jgi:hypothetical protein
MRLGIAITGLAIIGAFAALVFAFISQVDLAVIPRYQV